MSFDSERNENPILGKNLIFNLLQRFSDVGKSMFSTWCMDHFFSMNANQDQDLRPRFRFDDDRDSIHRERSCLALICRSIDLSRTGILNIVNLHYISRKCDHSK